MGEMHDTSPRQVGRSAAYGRVSDSGYVEVLDQPDRTSIVLSGNIDVDLADAMRVAQDVAVRSGRRVVVDATDVSFMDSVGLGFLQKLAMQSSERVTLLQPSHLVRVMLEASQVGALLDVQEHGAEPEDEPSTDGAADDLTARQGGRSAR